MRIRHYIYLAFLAAAVCSCVESDTASAPQTIVIEGAIENGGAPYVIVTRNWQFSAGQTSYPIQPNVIADARVTVSDGTTTYELTPRTDERFEPSLVYTTDALKGQTGGAYTLTVNHNGRSYSATTSIPVPPSVREFIFIDDKKAPSLYRLGAEINCTPGKHYYKIYSQRVDKDKRMLQSIPGNFDSEMFGSSKIQVPVNRGFDQNEEIFETRFGKDDVVLAKVCTQTHASFDFWTAYENDLLNGNNPLAPPYSNLPSNLSDNALGVWAGYGSAIYTVEYDVTEPVPYNE